ncbi:hypothetical protein [Mesorhizobium sp. Cs1321R2N1]|uniref:hypothetical protein n=1 Tax=Mesorhizobium sp. Cs1321R2N1 TaxID=3015174 RepID=UPI00301DDEE6
MQAVERQQHAGFLQLVIVFHHSFHRLGAGHDIGRGVRVAAGDHQHHKPHGLSPWLGWFNDMTNGQG